MPGLIAELLAVLLPELAFRMECCEEMVPPLGFTKLDMIGVLAT